MTAKFCLYLTKCHLVVHTMISADLSSLSQGSLIHRFSVVTKVYYFASGKNSFIRQIFCNQRNISEVLRDAFVLWLDIASNISRLMDESLVMSHPNNRWSLSRLTVLLFECWKLHFTKILQIIFAQSSGASKSLFRSHFSYNHLTILFP